MASDTSFHCQSSSHAEIIQTRDNQEPLSQRSRPCVDADEEDEEEEQEMQVSRSPTLIPQSSSMTPPRSSNIETKLSEALDAIQASIPSAMVAEPFWVKALVCSLGVAAASVWFARYDALRAR